jgi:hypothetical protein
MVKQAAISSIIIRALCFMRLSPFSVNKRLSCQKITRNIIAEPLVDLFQRSGFGSISEWLRKDPSLQKGILFATDG